MEATPLRRCIGSKTFGIEPHDAPISDFPTQPSQKDGLGRMCRPHWTAYTGALRKAALAKKAAATEPAPARHEDAEIAPFTLAKGPDGEPMVVPVFEARPAKPARAPRVGKPAKLAKANALLATIERLGGTDYTEAIGSEEGQAALEVVNGAGHDTPLDEANHAGTEEADLAIAE